MLEGRGFPREGAALLRLGETRAESRKKCSEEIGWRGRLLPKAHSFFQLPKLSWSTGRWGLGVFEF